MEEGCTPLAEEEFEELGTELGPITELLPPLLVICTDWGWYRV